MKRLLCLLESENHDLITVKNYFKSVLPTAIMVAFFFIPKYIVDNQYICLSVTDLVNIIYNTKN